MKAKLTDDRSYLRNGSVTIMNDSGEELARLVIPTVNPRLVDVTNFNQSVKKLAEQLVESINASAKSN